MTDLLALNARIGASGVKRVTIAQELGVTPPTLRRKLRGTSPITVDDIYAFGRVLNLNKQEISKIFFAGKVN